MAEIEVPVAGGAVVVAEDLGPPDGRPLLLATGVTGSMLRWPDAFCSRLAATGFRPIRFDNRDTGRSTAYPPGAPGYAIDDLVADVFAILDRFAIGRTHYFGLSMGGIVGQLAALERPDRIASLTVMATTAAVDAEPDLPPPAPALIAFLAAAAPPDWSDREAVIDWQTAFARATAGAGRAFDVAGVRSAAGRDFDRARDVASGTNHTRLGGGKRWEGCLARLAVPTTILHGDDDPLFPLAHAKALARTIPGADLVVLEGAGHEFHPDDWDRIIAAIRRTADRADAA